jgi:diacylglycerol kinase family enzyme
MKSSIVLIFNPTAKNASGRKIAKASHFLRSRGYKAEILFTEQKGHAESLAGCCKRITLSYSQPVVMAHSTK